MAEQARKDDRRPDTAAEAAEVFSRAAANGPGATSDVMKLFSQFKLPAFLDTGLLIQAHRRNLDTLAAANRVAMDAAQALARRNMEIAQQTMQDLGESVRHLTSSEPAQDKAAQGAERLKRSYEQAVAHMRELRDLIQRSNGEAVDLLNKRFLEAVDEAKTLLDKAQQNRAA